MSKKRIEYGFNEQDFMMGIFTTSVVDYPAIMTNFIALSEDKRVQYIAALKAAGFRLEGHIHPIAKLAEVQKERRMLFGPALIPNLDILRVDEQGGEFYIYYSKDTVEKGAHQYLIHNRHHNTNVMHQTPVEGAVIVESWIKEGPSDKSVQLGFDLPDGTWMVGMKITDDELWKEVQAGTLRGFSIEGMFMEVGLRMASSSYESDLLAEFKLAVLAHASM